MQDWNQRAGRFSVWLPHLQSATERLLAVYESKVREQKNPVILDLATGTGEPAGTLSKQISECTIIAVDQAIKMLQEARHRLGNSADRIILATMSGQAMALKENCCDVCISRFGIMLFKSPRLGIKEIVRVLRPGGWLFFTVWSDPEQMPSMKWCHDAFAGKIPEEALPPLGKATAMGHQRSTFQMLQSCGLVQIEMTEHELEFVFEDFSAYWECVIHSGIMQPQFEQLPQAQHELVRGEIEKMAQPYLHHGRLVVPHVYLCIQARKPPESF